jgi:outer membrane protein
VEDVDVPDQLAPQLKSVDEVLTTAYASQPQIKAAESRIKAAEAQTEVSKTAFWPTVTASAGIGSFYNNLLNTDNVVILFLCEEQGFFNNIKIISDSRQPFC